MNYHLAIDIGASGGRHILGWHEGGKLLLEEIYRFQNMPSRSGDHLVWDTEKLFSEIVNGIAACGVQHKIPRAIGIDMWGVDYALFNGDGALIEPVYSYRDVRGAAFTNTAIPLEQMYAITGIPELPFNTVYQLLSDQAQGRLDKATGFLMLPEYFSYRLVGKLGNSFTNIGVREYTNASTTGLLDANKRAWAQDLIKGLNLPERFFLPVKEPPYEAGSLCPAIRERVGFDAQVLIPATHDTASAVSITPADALYLSSGTWSLLGIQTRPILTKEAREGGYTNEGALHGNIRFLKNIIGLWMLQSIRHELGDAYSFSRLESLAKEAALKKARTKGLSAGDAEYGIDCNLPQFISPPSMIDAVKAECAAAGFPVPGDPGELALCVYQSLAKSYKDAIAGIEHITGKNYPALSIIGGGSKDQYLNTLIAAYTGKTVYAGPSEATAIGNLVMQMRHAGEITGDVWDVIKNSFEITEIK
ncbi:carbohydrate kinase [Spirochaetia bacterium]|nr:carbohydrate kinase [Spirochaetia bacterium]